MDENAPPVLDDIDHGTRRIYTLCFPLAGTRVLLGFKKRGFGSGRWNGFGGKLKQGETIEQAARRETWEEAGLAPVALRESGRLLFTFEGVAEAMEVHVFRTEDWTGEPAESDEMRPRWFEQTEIPFDEMWADDRYWLPHLLEGGFPRGHFHFRGDELLRYRLNVD